MKRVINRIFPDFLRTYLKIVYHSILLFYYGLCDSFLFLSNSSIINESNKQVKLVARISMAYHSLEKGLTMPKRRLGFGIKGAMHVISLCELYIAKNYDTSNNQFLHALGVLYEYRNVHVAKNFTLDDKIISRINKLEAEFPINSTEQLKSTPEEYFKFVDSSFDKFSESRYSLRNFEKGLDRTLIEKSVKLAMNTPSSCNRQAERVHIIQDDVARDKVLSIHKGNRGFGYLCDSIIIVTSEVGGYASAIERNAAYIDGGMFGMNLLYSLHYYKVGACVLNSNFTVKAAKKLRHICNIPKSEVFVMLILIGKVPQNFSIALSKRVESKNILGII